jgi:hypothetical protein
MRSQRWLAVTAAFHAMNARRQSTKGKDDPTTCSDPSPWHASRSALSVAFLVGLLWWLVIFNSLQFFVTGSSAAKFFVALLAPILTILALLYRTCLFRDMRRETRVCLLLLLSAGLTIVSIGPWMLGVSLVYLTVPTA